MRALVLLVCAAAAYGQNGVRVLTYNIHHGEGTDRRLDLERIAKVIAGADPDVAALQEVDVRTRRSGGVDQALELGRLTRMHAVFGRGILHEGGWYGNAILSRWPVEGFTNHALPGTPGRERRAAIEARIGAPLPFTFWATHLDIAERDRVLAAGALNAWVEQRPADAPMILAGDLNAVESSEPMTLLFRLWRMPPGEQPLWTMPADKPRRQIDYVLYRPAPGWRVEEARVLEESVASDHRPLLVVLEAVQ